MSERISNRPNPRKSSQLSENKKNKKREYERSEARSRSDDKFRSKYSPRTNRHPQNKIIKDKKNCKSDKKDRNKETETSISTRRGEEDFARNEKYREMRELERATRTVFVSNLHIKVNEKDLFILFSQKAGKVIDIYVICDKHTNKSKGLAYIELETIESMTRALSLSNTEMYGQSIYVRPSEMEKNVQWTLQKQSQQGIIASYSGPSMVSIPIPGVDIILAATTAAKLLIHDESHVLFNSSNSSQEVQRQRKIYIGNLPREINELVLRNMFEPFGAVESSNVIKDPTGKSQGYGFISFREKEIVDKAIQSMNGLLIGSNIIKVNYVTPGNANQPIQQPNTMGSSNSTGISMPPTTPCLDLDHVNDDDGLKINAQNRIVLMQKLASSANIDLLNTQNHPLPLNSHSITQQDQNSNSHSLHEIEGLLGKYSPIPTNCLLIKNMFDPKKTDLGQNWDLEIMKDVKEEAMKAGSVQHIFVDKNSQGFVYLKMATLNSATHTLNMLNGRIYGGRSVTVEYQSTQAYEKIFK